MRPALGSRGILGGPLPFRPTFVARRLPAAPGPGAQAVPRQLPPQRRSHERRGSRAGRLPPSLHRARSGRDGRSRLRSVSLLLLPSSRGPAPIQGRLSSASGPSGGTRARRPRRWWSCGRLWRGSWPWGPKPRCACCRRCLRALCWPEGQEGRPRARAPPQEQRDEAQLGAGGPAERPGRGGQPRADRAAKGAGRGGRLGFLRSAALDRARAPRRLPPRPPVSSLRQAPRALRRRGRRARTSSRWRAPGGSSRTGTSRGPRPGRAGASGRRGASSLGGQDAGRAGCLCPAPRLRRNRARARREEEHRQYSVEAGVNMLIGRLEEARKVEKQSAERVRMRGRPAPPPACPLGAGVPRVRLAARAPGRLLGARRCPVLSALFPPGACAGGGPSPRAAPLPPPTHPAAAVHWEIQGRRQARQRRPVLVAAGARGACAACARGERRGGAAEAALVVQDHAEGAPVIDGAAAEKQMGEPGVEEWGCCSCWGEKRSAAARLPAACCAGAASAATSCEAGRTRQGTARARTPGNLC